MKPPTHRERQIMQRLRGGGWLSRGIVPWHHATQLCSKNSVIVVRQAAVHLQI